MALDDAWPERRLVPYEASRFIARTVLVLAPHPDDEVFGCGAAIAALREDGAAVTVAIASDGAGTEASPEARRRVETARLAESRAAVEILGGPEVAIVALGFPDRGLAAAGRPLLEALGRLVAEVRPELVILPSPVEVHPDHRALAEAFLEVEVPGATTLAFYELSQPIRPNFLLDATRYAARKDLAMAAFVSQNAGHDYPGFVRGLNAYRRMTLPPAVTAAEAYHVATAGAVRAMPREAFLAALGPSGSPPSPRGPVEAVRELWSWLAGAWKEPV